MKTIKLFLLMCFIMLFTTCKEKDYRDKWCGNYDFTIIGIKTSDTVYSNGEIYYTKEIGENQIYIENYYFSLLRLNLITIDSLGVFQLPETYHAYQMGYFIDNNTMYYFYSEGISIKGTKNKK